MNKRRLMLVMFVLLALGGAIGGWWFSQSLPLLHPEAGSSNVAHAAAGETDGCAKCHTGALPYTNCLDSGCHDALVSTVGAGNNVYLAHHDVAATDDCVLCHENPSYEDDARYVVVPETGHNFCSSCHDMFQHGGSS